MHYPAANAFRVSAPTILQSGTSFAIILLLMDGHCLLSVTMASVIFPEVKNSWVAENCLHQCLEHGEGDNGTQATIGKSGEMAFIDFYKIKCSKYEKYCLFIYSSLLSSVLKILCDNNVMFILVIDGATAITSYGNL